jgi:RNA-splicing ligase RtcB
MRDGSLICIGKGNEDWSFSAPHGTGRIMSHSQAFKEMSLEDFKKSMKDVYSETVTEYTNDKSPMVINRNTKLWITLRILLILKLS